MIKSFITGLCGAMSIDLFFPLRTLKSDYTRNQFLQAQSRLPAGTNISLLRTGYIIHWMTLMGLLMWSILLWEQNGLPYSMAYAIAMMWFGLDWVSNTIVFLSKKAKII